MNRHFLAFEQPIAELQAKIEELRHVGNDTELNITEEIHKLEQKTESLTKSIFSDLSRWQTVQVARHPERPYAIDYIQNVFTEFDELHGDRHFADDHAIVGGVARLNGEPVMVIGQQKGRDTKERLYHNFGMPKPEGYRKALRLMHMAERFKMPIITLIDTAGAYPGIGAEERNQSEAIARNLFEMAKLRTPIICTVIGEGGSGGALALGVGDYVQMLQYSIYSVISPEGCATILWRSAEKADEAAEALKVTAQDALSFKLIDNIIEEPLGGAHRHGKAMAAALKQHLVTEMERLQAIPLDDLLAQRYERLMQFGVNHD